MKKFLLGVYVGASAVFIWGMFGEVNRLAGALNDYKRLFEDYQK